MSSKKKIIESDDILTDDGWNFKEVEVKIENLKEELKKDQYRMSVIEYNKKRAIFEMLKQVKDNEKESIKASVKVAKLVFINSCPYKICNQRRYTIPTKFKEFVKQTLLLKIGIIKQKTISDSTTRYIKFFSSTTKVRFDEYERNDVVEYHKMFLNEMAKYEPYMIINLTEACEQLKLDAQAIENYSNIPHEAFVYLISRKNQEGYWTMNHLLKQVKLKVIPIFEALFPICIAVFVFDNSSIHTIFLLDVLIASKMNLF
ncbi:hypothetical protein RCL_jg12194.t1 [Rhizophagus clarus]|uniref:Uncharacterized protein n=1 Tax=Rhizophagus clarus TaxID=94130 RepID=A0A8H3KYM2_9GLOM|nr:hypothetical protein RCL_jg12194.t1 [Rhizophagus clarus]